jgi:hypothetical protein
VLFDETWRRGTAVFQSGGRLFSDSTSAAPLLADAEEEE